MRLSSTPPNNFCKASVNQPTSLQQRQGAAIEAQTEMALHTIDANCGASILAGSKDVVQRTALEVQEHSQAIRQAISALTSHDDPFALQIDFSSPQYNPDIPGIHPIQIVNNTTKEVIDTHNLDNTTSSYLFFSLGELLAKLSNLSQQHASKG